MPANVGCPPISSKKVAGAGSLEVTFPFHQTAGRHPDVRDTARAVICGSSRRADES
jgi:hypothetical protein